MSLSTLLVFAGALFIAAGSWRAAITHQVRWRWWRAC